MSFPTTGTLDDFTRADENPLAGGWGPTIIPGDSKLKIASDQAVPSSDSAYCDQVYGTPIASGATEVWATLTGEGNDPFVAACLTNVDTLSLGGYFLICKSETSQLEILRFDSGGSSTSLGAWSATIADGDSIGLDVSGGTVTAYHKTSGSWSSVGSASDATYDTGYIGAGWLNTGSSPAAFTAFGGTVGAIPVTSKRGLYLKVTDLDGHAWETAASARPLLVRTQEQPQVTIPISDSRTGQIAVSVYEAIANVLANNPAKCVVKVEYVNPKGVSTLLLNGIVMNPETDFDAGTTTVQLHDHTMRLKKRNLGYDHACILLSWGITVNDTGEAYSSTVLDNFGLGEFYGINSIYGIPLDGKGLRLLLLDAAKGTNTPNAPSYQSGTPGLGIRFALGDSADSVDDANPQPAYVEVTEDGLTSYIPPTGVGGLINGITEGTGFTATLSSGSPTMTDVSFSGATDSKGDSSVSFSDIANYMALQGPGVPEFAYIESFDSGANTITMSANAIEDVDGTDAGLNAFVAEDAVYCQLTRGDVIYDDITDMVQAQGAFECDWIPVDSDHTGKSGADWAAGEFVELYTANLLGTDRSKDNSLGNVPVQFVHGLGGFHLVHSPDANSLITYAVECGSGGDIDPEDYLNKVTMISDTQDDYGLWEAWDMATAAGNGSTIISNRVLANRARAKLTAYQTPPEFITAKLDTDEVGAYCYGSDFFLGDIVTVYGKKGFVEVGPIDVRITEIGVTQVDENGNCQLALTMVPYLTSTPGISPEDV